MSLFSSKHDDDMRDMKDQEQEQEMDMDTNMSSGDMGKADDRTSDTRMSDMGDMSAERQEELRRQDREKRDQALDDAM